MDGNGPACAPTYPRCRRRGGARWLPCGPRPRAPNSVDPRVLARLSLTALVALGAPARLVERAHVAALRGDRTRAPLVRAGSGVRGRAGRAGPLAELHGAPAVTARSLTELAEESLVDGCLIEGVAAAAAAASLRAARDPRSARRSPSSRATKHHSRSGLGNRGLVLETGRRGPSPAAAEAGPPHALRQAAPRAAAAARERAGRARLPRACGRGAISWSKRGPKSHRALRAAAIFEMCQHARRVRSPAPRFRLHPDRPGLVPDPERAGHVVPAAARVLLHVEPGGDRVRRRRRHRARAAPIAIASKELVSKRGSPRCAPGRHPDLRRPTLDPETGDVFGTNPAHRPQPRLDRLTSCGLSTRQV